MKYTSMRNLWIALWVVLIFSAGSSHAAAPEAAQAYGKARPVLTRQPDGLYICEAEEFQIASETESGWRARPWGENYYAATFANSFLSRKAFLGAPEQCEPTTATMSIEVDKAGRYLVLVRYEAAYRFETQFQVEIEQSGRTVFRRLYGARKNLKIWAFGEKLKTELAWSWGAVENVVWEGHDAFVELQPGRATIRLTAAEQPEPAARRNVDLVMLTTDTAEVRKRIETEKYLPLDGLLTQSGDVWLRVTNRSDKPLTFQGKGAPGGGNFQQHSPYWVHQRRWELPTIRVEGHETTTWIEVGGLMDSLNDGQWFWTGNQPYRAEFGVRGPTGQIERLAVFEGEGDLTLAADADTRYGKRLRKLDQVLYDLLAELKRANPAPHGHAPQRTLIYAQTFVALDDGPHAAAVREFKQLFGLSDTTADTPGGRGYIDVRGVPTPKLEEFCRNLGPRAENIAVVSLGDEIGLPTPGGPTVQQEFRQWLMARGLKPSDVEPSATDWNQVPYNVDMASSREKPGAYYWSKRFQHDFGIRAIKQRTDILRAHLPHAGVGANYSPHYPIEHMFLGEVAKWITIFREDGMTLPWSEDYIWQLAVGSPQMNELNFDLFRAANRHHPERNIMYYVMPHMPNNTPHQWRRLFFGGLAHGMTMVNLFEFRPVHVAYTENHVDDPAMYTMILRSFRELGLFEDMVQDGRVRDGEAALWFSETSDIWQDGRGSFAAAKRALYTAIRHQQIPPDILVEQDALDGTLDRYRVLYLTDAHVSAEASRRIAAWVRSGGTLLATAHAGMFDERNAPNETLRDLLGIEPVDLIAPEEDVITFIKQDLPFASPLGTIAWPTADGGAPKQLPVFGAVSRVRLRGAKMIAAFADLRGETSSDSWPAVTEHTVGQGRAMYGAFLPGLTYYHSAIPKRPVDRGATDDAMVHLLPTQFEPLVAQWIAASGQHLALPIVCSVPLVEATRIDSPHGALITLVNWSGQPVKGLTVRVAERVPTASIQRASGKPVEHAFVDQSHVFTLDLDVADALILRSDSGSSR